MALNSNYKNNVVMLQVMYGVETHSELQWLECSILVQKFVKFNVFRSCQTMQ